MIKARLWKVIWSGVPCDNPDCKHLPEYVDHIIGDNYFLKHNTTCVEIVMGVSVDIYCLDCIKQIYQQLKPVLDSNLWVFL